MLLIVISLMVLVTIYAGSYFEYCTVKDWHRPYCSQMNGFGSFYAKDLRSSLFSGFLTLGGFLLSLKTFIVVNMKKEVFDNEKYKKEWGEQKKLDVDGKMGSRFDPLKDLANSLYVSIVFCVATAVSQLTIGLFEAIWSSIICLLLATISIMLLLKSLYLIRVNLNRMFEFLNKDC